MAAQWNSSEGARSWRLLLDPVELEQTRAAGEELTPLEIAYAALSAAQHSADLEYWTKRLATSPNSIPYIVEFAADSYNYPEPRLRANAMLHALPKSNVTPQIEPAMQNENIDELGQRLLAAVRTRTLGSVIETEFRLEDRGPLLDVLRQLPGLQ
jgi:hypothetical protein